MKQILIDKASSITGWSPELINESLETNGGKLIVQGVLQRAGAKNQNGRIYPKQILEKEVERYKAEFVKPGNALGELDHPECFTSGFSILTESRGWVKFEDLTKEDRVATMHPETRELEWQLPTKIIDEYYLGDTVVLTNRSLKIQVTPNHKFYVDKVGGYKASFVNAIDLTGTHLMPKTCKWSGIKDKTITVDGIKFKTDIYVKFMAWWLAEGWTVAANEKYFNYNVSISQSKKLNIQRIKTILNGMPFNYSEHYRKRDNSTEFTISNKQLSAYLKQFGKAQDKHVPQIIKDLAPEYIEMFLEEYLLADGCRSNRAQQRHIGGKTYNRISEQFYTTSERMAHDISELLIKTGCSATIQSKKSKYRMMELEVAGEVIQSNEFQYYKLRKTQPVEIVSEEIKYTGKELYTIIKRTSTHYQLANTQKTIEKYEGHVHCVDVPNHIIFVMSPEGATFWSGNSSTVEYKNASHRILDLWWQGDDVCGKIEVLNHLPAGKIVEGLLRHGVPLGISSRGLGSVKNIDESTVEVQNDFEFVCWDFVSNPSTQGAFMKIIKESTQSGTINLDKINDIIIDIIRLNGK